MWHTRGSLQSAATAEERAAKLYSLLELGLEATPDDVRTAYRRLARLWHPDRHRGGDHEATLRATLRFQEIAAAYEVLNNPERRKAYDLGLLEMLDVEGYLKRFQDLTLTASGLGMASCTSSRVPFGSSSSFSAPSPQSSSSWTSGTPDGRVRSSSSWKHEQQQHQLSDSLFHISLQEPSASSAAASGGGVPRWPLAGPAIAVRGF